MEFYASMKLNTDDKTMAAFSEGRGVSKGGKCWFAVESKTFKISIEEVQGKQRGIILEMSKGLGWSIVQMKLVGFYFAR